MKNLQEIVSSKEVAFGMNFRQIDCNCINEFVSESEIGQKWWSEDEELMYYKIQDENEDIIVFYFVSGKAIAL